MEAPQEGRKMSTPWVLCLVLLAAYALACMLLSLLVALVWRGGLHRVLQSSHALLALRLLPAVGAVVLLLGVALPAFWVYEPEYPSEDVGSLICILAGISLLLLSAAIRRGFVAWLDTRALLRRCKSLDSLLTTGMQRVEIVDVSVPLVAVVGGLRPRILIAKAMLSVCSQVEFREIVAHEMAHVHARDNLKLLWMIIAPDFLAWLRDGRTLTRRWRVAAEFEADKRAAGSDPLRRVALASALIKVARLMGRNGWDTVLAMPIGLDEVEGRVHQLLAPARHAPNSSVVKLLASGAALLLLALLPLYGWIHELLEFLVHFSF
jgi:Zn-dependent protease with chaperone function